MSSPALLSGSVNSTGIFVQGRALPAQPGSGDDNSINRLVISPNFFDVMGIPVVLGRGFTDRDNADGAEGRGDQRSGGAEVLPEPESDRRSGSARSPKTTGQIEIVGVLHDVKYNSVRDEAPPTMYVPYLQTRVGSAVFEVRTAGAPAARHAARSAKRSGRSIRTCR